MEDGGGVGPRPCVHSWLHASLALYQLCGKLLDSGSQSSVLPQAAKWKCNVRSVAPVVTFSLRSTRLRASRKVTCTQGG